MYYTSISGIKATGMRNSCVLKIRAPAVQPPLHYHFQVKFSALVLELGFGNLTSFTSSYVAGGSTSGAFKKLASF